MDAVSAETWPAFADPEPHLEELVLHKRLLDDLAGERCSQLHGAVLQSIVSVLSIPQNEEIR